MSDFLQGTILQPKSNRSGEEKGKLSDQVQTKANEIGQNANNVVDDNKVTAAGGDVVGTAKELGAGKCGVDVKETNMGNSIDKAEERWS
jgi:hypothetical protein